MVIFQFAMLVYQRVHGNLEMKDMMFGRIQNKSIINHEDIQVTGEHCHYYKAWDVRTCFRTTVAQILYLINHVRTNVLLEQAGATVALTAEPKLSSVLSR